MDAGHRVIDVLAFFQNHAAKIHHWIRQQTRTGSDPSWPRSARPGLEGQADDDALRAQIVAHLEAALAEPSRVWAAAHGV